MKDTVGSLPLNFPMSYCNLEGVICTQKHTAATQEELCTLLITLVLPNCAKWEENIN